MATIQQSMNNSDDSTSLKKNQSMEESKVRKSLVPLTFADKEKRASKFTEENDPYRYGRHEHGHANGGITYPDKEAIERQRKAIWDFVKQVGNILTEGTNIINTALPVTLFEARSYLERIPDPWSYAPFFLTRAALETDPLERMKLVICFLVAGWQFNIEQKKPFNPILGETYQAEWKDGTTVFLEQTSHHPPVAQWTMKGPADLYEFNGYGVWSAGISGLGNTLKGSQSGDQTLRFKDGTTYTWNLVTMWVKGLVYGERVIDYSGTLEIHDEKNQLHCELKCDPGAKSFLWSWFSRDVHIPNDYLAGAIYRQDEDSDEKEVLSNVEGSWIACLIFDDKVYWDIHEHKHHAEKATPSANPLPSDARFRLDRNALADGDIEAAQEYKIMLEEQQRRDKKLRKEGLKFAQSE